MSEDSAREKLIRAIATLLDKADYRKLRLVWIYASHLIGKAVEVRHILNPAGSPESTPPQNDPQGVPV